VALTMVGIEAFDTRGPEELPVPKPLLRDQALFLDFDGTLVDIAVAPNLIQPPAGLPRLLCGLSELLNGAVAVISGRSLDELIHLLAPFSGALGGQHGLERRRSDGNMLRCPVAPGIVRSRSVLASFAARHDGVMLEDKGGALALHYRQAPLLAAACRAFVECLVSANGGALKAIEGKMVLEVMPRSAGKGKAIAAFLSEPPFRGRVPVFVGDDTGDEDGFAVVDRLGGISARVGAGATIARHRLADPSAVLAWLARGVAG
jgi:trehalose 6-phosphate phosphatase